MKVTIKKGNHYPDKFFGFTKGRTVEAEIMFDKNCVFPVLKPGCEGDLNKLIGITPKYSHHHINSGRITWKPNRDNGLIDLYFYLYVNGIYPNKIEKKWWQFWIKGYNTDQKGYLCSVKPESEYYMYIYDNLDAYHFVIIGEGVKVDFTYNTVKRNRYSRSRICSFYFGGNCPAPQDVSINATIL